MKKKPLTVAGNPYRFPAEWVVHYMRGTEFFNDFDYTGACRDVRHPLVAIDCGRVFGPDGYVGRAEE